MMSLDIQSALVNLTPQQGGREFTADLSLSKLLQQLLKEVGVIQKAVITSPYIHVYIGVSKERLQFDENTMKIVDSVSLKLTVKQAELEKLFDVALPGLSFQGFRQSGDDVLLVFKFTPNTGVESAGLLQNQDKW